MFCYACMFDLVVSDLVFICIFLYVSIDHFGFVLSNFVLLSLVFFSTEPRAGPDKSVWRPWAGSLLEAPTHPQML